MHKYPRNMETMDRKKIICPIELNSSMTVNKTNFVPLLLVFCSPNNFAKREKSNQHFVLFSLL